MPAAFRPGFGELELRQGLTTIVNGNCGLSCAPVGPENLPAILSYLEPICGRVPPGAARETLAEYFAAQPAAPLHTGMLAGAGTVRASVAGYQVQRLEPEHYAADQARTIRIPVHMVETINKVIRVSRQLLQELGHDPSPEEIAEEMNMPVDKVREILKIAQEPVSPGDPHRRGGGLPSGRLHPRRGRLRAQPRPPASPC